jgi:hypothetical protein
MNSSVALVDLPAPLYVPFVQLSERAPEDFTRTACSEVHRQPVQPLLFLFCEADCDAVVG